MTVNTASSGPSRDADPRLYLTEDAGAPWMAASIPHRETPSGPETLPTRNPRRLPSGPWSVHTGVRRDVQRARGRDLGDVAVRGQCPVALVGCQLATRLPVRTAAGASRGERLPRPAKGGGVPQC